MADKAEKKKQKKQGTINQIIQIFKYTQAEDKALPWLCGGVFVAPIIVFVVLGVIFKWHVFSWILFMILAVMLGVLFATMMLTKRADKVGYAKIEGRPGAAVSVLGNISKAGFNFPQEPVWIDPKTKSRYIVKGVTAGSEIPVYRMYVGTGANQTRLKDVRKTLLKFKSYQPTHHKNKLMAAIHPRTRFVLTKTELTVLNERLRTLQLKNGMSDASAAREPSRHARPLTVESHYSVEKAPIASCDWSFSYIRSHTCPLIDTPLKGVTRPFVTLESPFFAKSHFEYVITKHSRNPNGE